MKQLTLLLCLLMAFSLPTFARDKNEGFGLKEFEKDNPNSNWKDNGSGQNPPAIDLAIDNMLQENANWCWLAVVQQIVYKAKTKAYTPQQCQLVTLATGQSPTVCCQTNSPCTTTGSLKEIQALFTQIGGLTTSYNRPTNPLDLYRTLAGGQAIILAVKGTPKTNHVVVIDGMAWVPFPVTVQPVVYINDPTGYFSHDTGIAFTDLAKYWSSALAVN